MQNAEHWQPSKYVQRSGRLRASRDTATLGVGSRLIADLVAERYELALSRHAHGRLVDLGCGHVPLYGCYRNLVDEVICVDWPQSVHGSPYLDLAADLSKPLPLHSASFDTVILSDVLEHVPDPELLMAEIARLLRPGGKLLLNIPFLYGLHELPHDYARYSETALRRFCARAGLSVLELQPVGGSAHVLADLLAKHLAHLPLLGRPLAALLQSLVRCTDRLSWGQRWARRSAERFPLGYFLVATPERASVSL